ncbi:hypothetical protein CHINAEXTREME_00085 [Halobiforma lacisalsi AJ5]|uniref:Uncharacterized protein n=1 Tax=Natronobacterium lacisalsi AJ5 TaxID=358396 RepID=M0LTC4_NATLA|nr:hypothetical protein [Halobiforma lacisalsi]APW96254.1 hypothetical protein CHINAEXTREME_00085 [Halobiforma lacisalsi AJ5]EMA36403.1 hypothetical protein C445_03193 [Halobiforma lacisalsi AJ5]
MAAAPGLSLSRAFLAPAASLVTAALFDLATGPALLHAASLIALATAVLVSAAIGSASRRTHLVVRAGLVPAPACLALPSIVVAVAVLVLTTAAFVPPFAGPSGRLGVSLAARSVSPSVPVTVSVFLPALVPAAAFLLARTVTRLAAVTSAAPALHSAAVATHVGFLPPTSSPVSRPRLRSLGLPAASNLRAIIAPVVVTCFAAVLERSLPACVRLESTSIAAAVAGSGTTPIAVAAAALHVAAAAAGPVSAFASPSAFVGPSAAFAAAPARRVVHSSTTVLAAVTAAIPVPVAFADVPALGPHRAAVPFGSSTAFPTAVPFGSSAPPVAFVRSMLAFALVPPPVVVSVAHGCSGMVDAPLMALRRYRLPRASG